MSAKLGFSEEGKNVDRGDLRRVCRGDYLGRRQREIEIERETKTMQKLRS
jgi:hypothetical protein